MYSVHDLHVWELVDGMSIGTVHIVVDYESDIKTIFSSLKVFLRFKFGFVFRRWWE